MTGTYQDYLDLLGLKESTDDYQAENYAHYLGRYQMGEGALIDTGYVNNDGNYLDNNYSGGWTGKDGVYSKSDFLNTPTAQENAIREYNQKNWSYIEADGLDKYIGHNVGGIDITPSGLLGASHLKGTKDVKKFLESGGAIDPKDGNGTSVSDYLEEFQDFETPFDAGIPPTPPPLPPFKMPEIPDLLDDWFDMFLWSATAYDPLVLDLDGDGVELTSLTGTTETFFDVDNDGFAEQTAWVGADDGLLVQDINENGIIDDASELFGEGLRDGFSKLQPFDTNGDLLINSADTAWEELFVWQDTNGNAITDDGELLSMDDLNIAAIRLNDIAPSATTINGNRVTQTATYVLDNGTSRTIADVWFNEDQRNSYSTQEYTFDIRAAFLPSLRGFGDMKDMHQAMSQDETLLDLMATFVEGVDASIFADPETLNGQVDELLFAWAGTVPQNEHENNYAEHIQFLEAFFGQPVVPTEVLSREQRTLLAAGYRLLEDSYEGIRENLKTHILMQTEIGKALFDDTAYYNIWTGKVEGVLDLSEDAINALIPFASAGGVDELVYWQEVAKLIDASKGLSNLTGTEEGWLDTAVDATNNTLVWADIEASLLPGSSTNVYGTSGNDTINATAANEKIYADTGNDTVNAGSGDDEVFGHDGTDTINGEAGHDILHGEAGADTLTGGTGDDFAYGGAGDDTYVYTSGDDYYQDNISGGTDTITLPAGIETSDLAFEIRGGTSLFIIVGELGTIEVGLQYTSSYAIESLVLADTTTINLTTLDGLTVHGTGGNDPLVGRGGSSSDVLYGYSGNDDLTGQSGDDTLDGGSGNDFLDGGFGNDTYIFSPGFDRIVNIGGTDVIVLPEWVTEGDISISRLYSAANPNGYDMTILVSGLGQVTVQSQFFSSGHGVETLFYGENGENEIDLQNLDVFSIGTTGDNGMGAASNSSGNDTYDGREGNDLYQDYDGGDDTYYLSSGSDTISDANGSDTIKFLPGVEFGDLTITRVTAPSSSNYYDMLITDGLGNQVRVSNQFNVPSAGQYYQIETLAFSSGSPVSLSSIEIDTVGTSGNDSISGVAIGDASNVDTIYGYGGNDNLNGMDGNDTLYGGDGLDNVNGGVGNDTIYGDSGNDTLYGGESGNDTLYGGDGDDIIYGENSSGGVTHGNDILYGGAGNDKLFGLEGNDTYYYTSGWDFVEETGGTDSVYLPSGITSGDVHVYSANDNDLAIQVGSLGWIFVSGHGGGGGAAIEGLYLYDTTSISLSPTNASTVLYGMPNGATLSGTSGNDTFYAFGDTFFGGATTMYGYAGNDTFYGGDNGNTIQAGDGNDVFYGGAVADTFYGENNNDTMNGGGGNDTLYGDAGDDIYIQSAGVDIFEDSSGTDEIQFSSGITASNLTYSRTGNNLLVYVDSVHAFTINNHYTTGYIETFRFSNSTTVSGPAEVVYGTSGNDTINGTNLGEEIHGLAGNDTINAGAGNDSIYGNAGDDVIDGGDGVDTAYYTTGVAYINLDLGYAAGTDGEGGLDTITNVENIVGSAYDDFIDGNSSNNTLWGGAGGDVITGYTGDDILYGEDGADYLWGNEGNDTLYGGAGNDPLYGLEGNDTLYGGDGNDTMRGDDANSDSGFSGAGNDVLYGGVGNDVMAGGAGNDILWGDDGVDTMYGNAGDDTFAYNSAALNTTSHDIISDFALADDVLDLSDIMTNYVSGTSDVDDYVKTVSIASTHTRIQVDIDGTGTTYTWMNLAQIQNINTTTFGTVENAVTNGIIVL